MRSKRDKEQIVVLTGIGMICPLGVTTAESWANMLEGKSGIKRITRFDPSDCLTQIAGELPDTYFDLEKEAFSADNLAQTILPTRMTVLSARQAIEDGQIQLEDIDRREVAVITGCGASFGDQNMLGETNETLSLSHEMHNGLSTCLSREFGFLGPSFNVATACASGAFAIAVGYDYVRRGGKLCLAVGVDTILVKETIDGFNQLLALSDQNKYPEKASRPFDKNRSGFVISEAACAVILEPYEHAVRRGAKIYAVMSGHAATSEAYNIVAPEPEGNAMATTMELAIQNSDVPKDKIGYISAHGTSTPYNDLAETRAIKRVFGADAYKIPVSSQKSMIGHSIGAAGAIEFAVTALSLYHQAITPTINYEYPDPECDLDYVPNEARRVQTLEAALTNSFGFGGHNCCLVLERHDVPLK